MTPDETQLLAKCGWKENRHGGIPGMTSIMNVVQNRCAKHGKKVEQIIMAPYQFTSMSVPSDPEYNLDPNESTGLDFAMWQQAEILALQAAAGTLADLTQGSTLYYAPKSIVTDKTFTLPSGAQVPWPETWNQAVVRFAGEIANQLFFVET